MPFTHDQFLDVFAAYHRALWPAAVAWWLVTLAVLWPMARRGPVASRGVALLLAGQWAWSAVAYHVGFFRAINPAAAVFAVGFLVQAGLFAAWGIAARRSVVTPSRTWRDVMAVVWIGYAMVYPALGVLSGLSYPRMPTFGLPCPTTILTCGLLLLLPRGDAMRLGVIPLLWSMIGGTAAWRLGIPADAALPLAAATVVVHVLAKERRAVPASGTA
jgi:hypothetical protein